MNHAKPQMFLQGIKFSIAMEKRAISFDTEGRNQAADGFAHRAPALSPGSVTGLASWKSGVL